MADQIPSSDEFQGLQGWLKEVENGIRHGLDTAFDAEAGLQQIRASLRVSNSAREFYFAALLARSEEGWEASDVDLDDVETMDDLVSAAREVAVADHPVLLFIEQEDRWFSVVRLNDAQTPRIYVSDAASAADSSCGVLLLTELLGREHPSSMVGPAHGPVGDTAVLEDLGVPPADLLSLDVDALADLAEALETAANLSGLPRHP